MPKRKVTRASDFVSDGARDGGSDGPGRHRLHEPRHLDRIATDVQATVSDVAGVVDLIKACVR